jgi:hypothetical protein
MDKPIEKQQPLDHTGVSLDIRGTPFGYERAAHLRVTSRAA